MGADENDDEAEGRVPRERASERANTPSIATWPCGSASVEALLMEEQIDAERLQLRQKANDVLQAPSEALLEGHPPCHQATLEIGGLGHGACFFGNNGRPPRFNRHVA
jgi:hypothetical protein